MTWATIGAMSTQDPNDPSYNLPAAPPEPTGYAAAQRPHYTRPPMPKEVNWATLLMLLSIVISLVGVIILLADKNGYIKAVRDSNPDYSQKKLDDTFKAARVVAIVIFVIVAVLYAWLILKIRQGRNWARIVATVLLVLGIVSNVSTMASNGTGATKAFEVVGLIIAVAVLVLLWLRPSNAYFKEVPPGAAA